MEDNTMKHPDGLTGDWNNEYLNDVIAYVKKHKGKIIPTDKFKNTTKVKLVGYDTTCALFICRAPLGVGWEWKYANPKTDILVYNRFKLERYSYCYLSPYTCIYV